MAVTGGSLGEQATPGALNQGWDVYLQWVNTNYQEFSGQFKAAEEQRRTEDSRWRTYIKRIYADEQGWKKWTRLALNGIQIAFLYKQFEQQKEISDRTYELADKQQKIAEEIYQFYQDTYMPHEKALGAQIDGYYDNPYRPNYDGTGALFAENMEQSFRSAQAKLNLCNSQECTPVTLMDMKYLALAEAQAVDNARNSAFRYEELRKEYYDDRWLKLRTEFIKMGRNISKQGQSGLQNAFNSFTAFGADPGLALQQLLASVGTFMGGLINTPLSPDGNFNKVPTMDPLRYSPYFALAKQTGDIQQGKAVRGTRTRGVIYGISSI